jgi:hypothetical protein
MGNFSQLIKKSLKLYMGTKWSYLLIIFLIGVFGIVFLFGETDTKLTLNFVYLFAPIFLIIVPATLISSEKNSRFTELTLTYPVSEPEYFFSRYLLSVIMGLLYLVVTLPFMAIYFAFVGMPLAGMFLKYFIASILIILFISGLGTMIASVCGSRQTVSLAISLIFAFGYILAGLFYGYPESKGNIIISAFMRLSPIVSISDYMGFPPIVAGPYVDRGISLVVPIVSILLFPLVGFLVFAYLKEKKKVMAVTLVALSIVAPALVVAIDTNYKIVERYDYWPWTDRDVILLREDDVSNLSEEEMVRLFEKREELWPELIEEELVLNSGENNINAIAIVKMNLNISKYKDPLLIPEEVDVELTFESDALLFDGKEEQRYKCKLKKDTIIYGDVLNPFIWTKTPTINIKVDHSIDIKGNHIVEIFGKSSDVHIKKPSYRTIIPYSLTSNFIPYSILAFIPTLLVVSMPVLLRKSRCKK